MEKLVRSHVAQGAPSGVVHGGASTDPQLVHNSLNHKPSLSGRLHLNHNRLLRGFVNPSHAIKYNRSQPREKKVIWEVKKQSK